VVCVRFNNRPSLLTDRLQAQYYSVTHVAGGATRSKYSATTFLESPSRMRLAVVDPDRALAELAHQRRAVRHQDYRNARGPWNSRILARHFSWKNMSPTASTSSTNSRSGLLCTATCKAEPSVHAGRVTFHRRVDELGQLRELHDRIELLVNLATGHAEDRAVEVQRFRAPSGLGWKPAPSSNQGRNAANHVDLAGGRRGDAAISFSAVLLPLAVAAR